MRIQSIILLTIIAIIGYATCHDEEALTEYDHKGIPYSEFEKKENDYKAFVKKQEAMEKNRDQRSAINFDKEEFEDCDEDELNHFEKESEDDENEEEDDEEDEEEEEDDDVREEFDDDRYIFSSKDLEYLDKN